jgi:hypothetical protein
MRLLAICFLVASINALEKASALHTAGTDSTVTASVKDFGAKGDGATDDRLAVQAAIDSLLKGGTVCFPAGTYLMNSYITSRAGNNYNLVTSHDNLTLAPCAGVPNGTVKLIQGPLGWGTRRNMVFGPVAVFNSTFFLASPIGQNGYQNKTQNGGYYALKAPLPSGANSVVFSTKAEAARFVAGDWIAVSVTTDQQVAPLEINQVVSASASTGVVVLRWPQTATYPIAFAANVTRLLRSHVSINGLTLQGAVPSFLNDLYDISITNCKLIADTTYVGPGNGIYMFANAVRKLLFKDNVISSYPYGIEARPSGVELPQNNSIDVTIDHNTFLVPAGAGEYSEHWTIKNNTFEIPAASRAGLVFQGFDISFTGNVVKSVGNIDYLYSDNSSGPNRYNWLFGAQKIRGNHFSSAAGKYVVRIFTPDTEFSGNQIMGGPEQHGLAVTISGVPHGNIPSSAAKATNVIANNSFHCTVTSAFGCVLLSGASIDGMSFNNNTLVGQSNSAYGIWIKSDTEDEKHRTPALDGNHYEGFKTPVLNEPKRHP